MSVFSFVYLIFPFLSFYFIIGWIYELNKRIFKFSNCVFQIIIEKGKPIDYFVLIVEGRVQANIGREELIFESGPFSYYGLQVIANVGTCTTKSGKARGCLRYATNFVFTFLGHPCRPCLHFFGLRTFLGHKASLSTMLTFLGSMLYYWA